MKHFAFEKVALLSSYKWQSSRAYAALFCIAKRGLFASQLVAKEGMFGDHNGSIRGSICSVCDEIWESVGMKENAIMPSDKLNSE
jgi:hypothetical protein